MKKFLTYAVIGLASGFLNGALGAGGGSVVVPALERLLAVPPQKAHATAIAVILPVTMVSAFFYLRHGAVNAAQTALIALGGTAGGLLGAGALKKLSGKAVRIAFAVSMTAAGIRMLWT
ncbi:MAG: TSUP family transporter [Clostridiales bacterium]|jgi:uncharacterized membrane protein YfcA|nr:TSUP family transporter [Clostridiales bacterium]